MPGTIWWLVFLHHIIMMMSIIHLGERALQFLFCISQVNDLVYFSFLLLPTLFWRNEREFKGQFAGMLILDAPLSIRNLRSLALVTYVDLFKATKGIKSKLTHYTEQSTESTSIWKILSRKKFHTNVSESSGSAL